MTSIGEILELAEVYDRELPEPSGRPTPPIGANIASWIDHTLLKPEATADQVKSLCQEARRYSFASVCINPAFVSLAAGLLIGSNIPVCSVAGFPLGASLPTYKVIETLSCLSAGADFVKTSTGFGPGGATVEDEDLMHRVVVPQVRVKAAGGIRDLETARAMIAVGASCLGASAGIQIVKETIG